MTAEDQPPTTNPVSTTVEIDYSDTDSAFDDGSSTASTSLASIALKYEWRHGRRYHSYHSGQYSFPNDDIEQARLDMIHHVFYLLLNERLFLAPIDPEGLSILDLGTGTGIWPIELGDMYRGADIVGNDLSPIQPEWAPPNVRFYVDDIENDWEEPVQYDYIHCRYMAGAVKDWPRLIRQIYGALKPGGWVELQESANTLYSEDGSLEPNNPMVQMMDNLMLACEKIGRTMDPAPSFKQWVHEAGFDGVQQQRFKLPIGSWPKDPRMKEIGTLMGVNFREGVGAFTAALFGDVLGWPRPDVELFNASVRKATGERGVHPLFDFLVVTAQKPR
ncbi:hypothetical protein N3K66_007247 [Trichothecium roseum]|uniref:Uncharacterized protein n=1 Tax=Trichothecium roseum TaxID=47278 RepID=A0ACC0UUP8_9HYPO|nr:hypothetical protein N3K66_007247 [Trichothecium roseum]